MKRFILLPLFFLLCCCIPEWQLDLKPFYEESCTLKQVNYDSIQSFANKFSEATRGLDCQKDPFYELIVINIDSAIISCGLTINIDTTWHGVIDMPLD